ncbi:agmatinase [Aureimonas altamirensis DSM 21988]|uniref:Agmatinase n=1 Tax=Aureimonas altamirensis DSM 21988 TaxID=1121026 RepID=A0ABY1I5Y3_9HYPH|nr:agmatinase [Aureimonas altamirensis DSM 21988]
MTTMPLTVPAATSYGSFLYSTVDTDLDSLAADIAFLGIPHGSAYTPDALSNDQINAPDTIRRMTDRVSRSLERHDFDVGGPIYDNRPVRAVDVGNVPYDLEVPGGGHFARAEEAVRKILKAGAMPITFGGDHGIPIPIFRALSELGGDPITLVQIDAHIDWRNDVNGVHDGLSSPIRRASEMAHIGEIFQIGIRAQGSGRPEEYEAAMAYGAQIIPAFEVHDGGIDAVLARIPAGGRYYITIDADGLDPSEAPGVEGPAPGGLTFHQCRRLIHGLVGKGRVVGMDIVEITPARDVNNITSIVAGRLAVNLIGAAVRAGYFDR